MDKFIFTFIASLLFLSIPATTAADGDGDLLIFVIHVQPPSTGDLDSYYKSFLPASGRMVFAYSEVFSGFAALLTNAKVEAMKGKLGVVRVFPDMQFPLLTTHTPEFIGLHQRAGVWNASSLGAGVIIGMIDSGVDPTHPSFADNGVPPPPAKWKGSSSCVGCNNKLIGIKSFVNFSEVDRVGHGTHTASTAAGNFVHGANFHGLANGTASGMAPHAHLAIYQVCVVSCPISSTLAGIDAAVKDGVDVLSISLGGSPTTYEDDPIAIATLGATNKGVMVVCAGGNSGPAPATVSNAAPWILTVAASTTDRSLKSTVTLGDGQAFDGESLYQPSNATSSMSPLYYPSFGNCMDGLSSKPEAVKGKLVVCNRETTHDFYIDDFLTDAGAVGMIIIGAPGQGFEKVDMIHSLPVSDVDLEDGYKIVSYLTSTPNPTGIITFKGTVLEVSPAPAAAFFSSRGPNSHSSGVMKPDIAGPGTNILAAWPTKLGTWSFQITSGTSVAASHLSGIAALLKSLHPEWSPAAIKSAMMTTSDIVDKDGGHIVDEQRSNSNVYEVGSGHVNPSKAADPGLIYDMDVDDYAGYLCGRQLGDSVVGAIVGRSNFSCSDVDEITEAQLNYPSILVNVVSGTVVVNRTVTNVGPANSTYTAKLELPAGMDVSVGPEELKFTAVGQKMSFQVTVKQQNNSNGDGNLNWVSGDHVVRTPISYVVWWIIPDKKP